MTSRDEARFHIKFNRVAMAFRLPLAECKDPMQRKLYWDVLAEFSITAVEAAGEELIRTGGAFFPTTSLWFEAARLQSLRQHETVSYQLPEEATISPERHAALLEQLKHTIKAMPIPTAIPKHRDFVRMYDRRCPECGATTDQLTHAEDCSKGVQRPEVSP